MTPWLSASFDERSRSTHKSSNWHHSHDFHVQSHPYATIPAALGDDFRHFGTSLSRSPPAIPHNIASHTTSRFNDTIVHAYQSSSLFPMLQHGGYIPALDSSSQPPYSPGPAPFVTGGTWIETTTGEKQVFFQPLDTHTPTSSSFSPTNISPSHIDGPTLSLSSPSILDRHIPCDLMHEVHLDRQLPHPTARQCQVRSADTPTPDFPNHYFSTPPPPSSSYPRIRPNSGSGILNVCHSCLWVEHGVFCNSMVQATRSQMNRHLRTSHGFSGPETRPARCNWVGCGESMQQGSIARHMVTCHLQAKVTCPRCFKKLSRSDVMPKHERVCPAANR